MHIDETEAPRLRHAFRQFERERKTHGACLIHGLTLIETTLPFPVDRAHKLKRHILELVDHFADSGRPVRLASFGFNDGYLMIAANKQVALGVMHSSMDDLDEIEKRARAVLSDTLNAVPPPPIPREERASLFSESHPIMKQRLSEPNVRPIPRALEPVTHARPQPGAKRSPEPDADATLLWGDFRPQLEALLSKVMGDAQASRMVEREMAKNNIEEALEMSPAEVRSFGRQVLERVPNRSKRDTLIQELDALL